MAVDRLRGSPPVDYRSWQEKGKESEKERSERGSCVRAVAKGTVTAVVADCCGGKVQCDSFYEAPRLQT